MSKKCVKFIKPMSNFKKGDIGAFDDKMADKIIAAGYGNEVAIEDTKINKK